MRAILVWALIRRVDLHSNRLPDGIWGKLVRVRASAVVREQEA
jgi:hypothetical protein